ncbi:hypothetical protein MGU_02732 [Metarhizium guizhouense ARSEF 977]|uniref:Uncharacterized protein n=1 Tax=Metarhizium guizhouense (strain ARSEF 977) TaxID=1276136 RepID=A0A0B4HD01_METGA|nr:hypothetical protein MGU_02732 [Metarhizium guizhouense ARSEF 977]
MKVSSAFVLTLLTGALAAPSIVSDPDFEKRDVDAAAREFKDAAIADAVEARQVDTTVTLDQRDEDAEMVARAPGNGGNANAQGAKNQAGKKKGGNANAQGAKNQAGKKKGGNANAQGAKNQAGKKAGKNNAASKSAEAARVTSSFDAPGVVL